MSLTLAATSILLNPIQLPIEKSSIKGQVINIVISFESNLRPKNEIFFIEWAEKMAFVGKLLIIFC